MDTVYAKIDKTSTCWLWTGTLNVYGYGLAWYGKKLHMAHRLVYEHEREPIPKGMVTDHICRVRKCVNPDHIEIVTNGANVLRGVSNSAVNARKKFCKNGHEFSPENTYVYPNGWRGCRTCRSSKPHSKQVATQV